MSKLEDYASGSGALLNAKKVVDQGIKNKPLTIESVTWSVLKEGEGEKPVVSFKGISDKLVLNKTNTATLIKEFGVDEKAWTGRSIVLFITQKKFQGQMVDSITVAV